ncbi:MAG: type IV toxin-antitoxin system AbiEi family antitoxin domain-containing protein [Thermoplasmata archaeon]
MNKLTIVKRLESSRMALFTPAQISTILDKNINSTRVLLSRLESEGILTRVKRGHYCLPSTPVLSVASNIYPPSYISLWAAFEYHGTTTQSPRVIDVVNTSKSGRRELSLEGGNYEIRFIKTDESNIYGMEKVLLDGKEAFIADKEKAVVDGLLFNEYIPLGEVIDALKDGIDVEKAVKYAKKYGKIAAMKRLGYLLDKENYDCKPSDFGGLSNTYVPLDPSLERRGKYDSTWHMIDNRRGV